MTHVLLDTSPIIAHLRGKLDLPSVLPQDGLLFTSLFTVGELEKGINRVGHPEKERAQVESFLKGIAILMPDEATAAAYGKISGRLDSQGQRIPENDMWIAAVALECGMKLATGDAHFERVAGIELLSLSW
ncbi:MAG: PIN domain-containing protein [Verrucomicrobiales bacterium]|nr:PIN domain-containing protein [Verrucomicrobiales bacterium]